MEDVVYITGAGFSAVAGLPVMSNFLEKAKDIYFNHPEKYEHFLPVIDYINDLSYIKNYYDSDLHNIEEILSIIEMVENVSKREEVGFKKFIEDSIKYYTPQIKKTDDLDINHLNFFGKPSFYKLLGAFLLSLTNTYYKPRKRKVNRVGIDQEYRFELEFDANKNSNNRYSIITLNYDRLIESIFEYAINHESFILSREDLFQREDGGLKLFKLHGSIGEEIIPPTWNKMVNKKVQSYWEGAFKALSKTQHIRILGYSLPESDSYIKYLFKAAVSVNKYLKTIDVICLDDNENTVERRYTDFVNFPNFRFKNGDLRTYLTKFYEPLYEPVIEEMLQTGKEKHFSYCEKIHTQFMNSSL